MTKAAMTSAFTSSAMTAPLDIAPDAVRAGELTPGSGDDDVRVLFISGWGRSGSTLLNRLLHTTLSVCAVGELRDIWQRGPIENRLCSCGRDFLQCDLWAAVGEDAFGGWHNIDAHALQSLRLELDRPWHLAHLAKPDLRRDYARKLAEYGDALRPLYRAIRDVSQAPIVVESTKIPTHGMLLARVGGLDVRSVHLIRDSRGSAFSWQQQTERAGSRSGGADEMPQYSAAAAGVRYDLYNGMAHLLGRMGVPTVRLRYEDLVVDPIPSLIRVARHAWDIPLRHVDGLAQRRVRFAQDHVLDANPMRFEQTVTLSRDDRWLDEMARRDRAVVTAMTAPLLARYRYSLDGPAEPVPLPPPPPAATPSVAVVVPTRDRPVLLRRTLDAIFSQTYAGHVEAVVVYDHAEPDPALAKEYVGRSVTVMTNQRVPGLAGARNSGIEAARHADWIAFCDDDDEWMPHKLERQFARLERSPDADVLVSGILVDYDGHMNARVPGMDEIRFANLLRSRVFEAHPSTVMARTSALLGDIGLVDEEIPGSYGEDYEWMLRAAKRQPIPVADEPLVRVRWHAGSFFADRWKTLIKTHDYLLERFPEFRDDPIGMARITGRKALAYAASEEYPEARRHAREAMRLNPREPRAYIVLAIAAGIVKPGTVISTAHRFGRGV